MRAFMLRLVGFALLLFLFVLSFLGYFLTAQRLRTPLPPEAVVVERGGQAFTLRARLARTPEAWRLGLGLRREDLEALLYLFPEATDAPFSTEGYRFPVVVAFLDGEGRVLRVARLEPGESVAPGTAYRGVLEVRAGAFEPRPGDRVLP